MLCGVTTPTLLLVLQERNILTLPACAIFAVFLIAVFVFTVVLSVLQVTKAKEYHESVQNRLCVPFACTCGVVSLLDRRCVMGCNCAVMVHGQRLLKIAACLALGNWTCLCDT